LIVSDFNFLSSFMSHSKNSIEEGRKRLLEGLGVPEATPFVIDDFQLHAIESVNSGHDTLVVAPTGSGKTFIAFEALAAGVKMGRRGVYTTPLKALSNTKYNDLRLRFKDFCEVGLLTGDRKIDSNADIVVATTEIYRNELYRGASDDALVVLDEVHFIADPQRGPVWEESIILTPRTSTLLMLSASISNSAEIADWISETRGRPCNVVTKVGRPVELRYAFLHPGLGILPLRNSEKGVFREVEQYYAGAKVDHSGMRLKGGQFSRPKRRDRQHEGDNKSFQRKSTDRKRSSRDKS
jgi:superfamily II RNA helicase